MYKLNAIILILIICSVSCNTSKKFVQKKQMKESFIYDFKIIYYKSLLKKAYNNSQEIKTILSAEASGYGEIILSKEDFSLIDSLTKKDNEVIIKDSIDQVGRVSEGVQGKNILAFSMSKFYSKWLDGIAKERAKIYLKERYMKE